MGTPSHPPPWPFSNFSMSLIYLVVNSLVFVSLALGVVSVALVIV
jgi:hypothetical protein